MMTRRKRDRLRRKYNAARRRAPWRMFSMYQWWRLLPAQLRNVKLICKKQKG